MSLSHVRATATGMCVSAHSNADNAAGRLASRTPGPCKGGSKQAPPAVPTCTGERREKSAGKSRSECGGWNLQFKLIRTSPHWGRLGPGPHTAVLRSVCGASTRARCTRQDVVQSATWPGPPPSCSASLKDALAPRARPADLAATPLGLYGFALRHVAYGSSGYTDPQLAARVRKINPDGLLRDAMHCVSDHAGQRAGSTSIGRSRLAANCQTLKGHAHAASWP